MRKSKPEYRKARESVLKAQWYGHNKIEGGPYWPTCPCCNGAFGRPTGNNKRLIHRYIRHKSKPIVVNDD